MKLNIKSNIDFRYAGMVSAVVLVFGLIISFLIVPSIVNYMVKKMTILTPGSFFRTHQDKVSYTLKYYQFNITNPDEVVAGAIPKIKEAGPYVYEFHKMRINQVDDEDADTLTYDLKTLLYYRPDLSVPDAPNQTICTISALMGSVLTKTIIETPELLTFVQTGIGLIHGNSSSPIVCFHPLKVTHEGYYINCDQTEFAAKAICAALAAQDAIKKINGSEKHLKLATLYKPNDTIQATYTILRGKKNLSDVGKIIAINGDPLIDVHEYDKCNEINGTDMISFPPHQRKEGVQWIYLHDACRSIPLQYTSKKRIHGIKTLLKEFHWNSSLVDPDCNYNEYLEHGYSGTLDLHDCHEFFGYAVGPHNYLADPLFSQNIDGYAQDKEKHYTGWYLDPLTGARLLSYLRFQINVLIRPIPDHPLMHNILELNLPSHWMEFKYESPKNITGRLQALHTGKSIGNFLGRFILLMGLIGCLTSIAAMALGIGPEIPKIINVVPNSGEMTHSEAPKTDSASTRTD